MKLAKLFAAAALTVTAFAAQALDIKPYSHEALESAQKSGKPVALHFHAEWCPTCRAQAKVFKEFSSDKSLDMTLLVVDFDDEKSLKQKLGVRVQSVLIVYRGNQETSRLAGYTQADALRAALKTAL